MLIIGLGLASMLVPAGTLAHAGTTSPMIVQAKKIIAAEMVDPSSLQYRNLRIVRGTVQGKVLTIACGEYNARNKMGGYTGYATFAYEPTQLRGVVSYKAEGGIDLFGDLGRSPNDVVIETKARVLAVCMGIPQ